jgi:ATP-dependent Clp protease adapter protein ClpS
MSQHQSDLPPVSSASHRPLHKERSQEQAGRRELPPYKLILLHDATLDIMFVVRSVMELTRFCRAEATHKMWEAHHCGRSLLLVTYKERAELYAEQFASKGIPVVIEPA